VPRPPGKNNYEVGYGKPPAHTRFQKGRSGNPQGGRRRARSPWKILDKELSRKLKITENGQIKSVTTFEALVKRLISKGLSGDRLSILKVFALAERAVDAPDEGAAKEASRATDEQVLQWIQQEFKKETT